MKVEGFETVERKRKVKEAQGAVDNSGNPRIDHVMAGRRTRQSRGMHRAPVATGRQNNMIQTTLDRVLIGPGGPNVEDEHENTQGGDGGGTTESQEDSESSEGESWGASVSRGDKGGQRGTRSSARLTVAWAAPP